MLCQGTALFDSMNVEENVIFPLNMLTNMTLIEKLDRVNFSIWIIMLQHMGEDLINHVMMELIDGYNDLQ